MTKKCTLKFKISYLYSVFKKSEKFMTILIIFINSRQGQFNVFFFFFKYYISVHKCRYRYIQVCIFDFWFTHSIATRANIHWAPHGIYFEQDIFWPCVLVIINIIQLKKKKSLLLFKWRKKIYDIIRSRIRKINLTLKFIFHIKISRKIK